MSKLTYKICFIGLTSAVLPICAPALAQTNVLTSNYNNDRTNANLQETILNPSNVNTANFGKIGVFPVDGQIYAQPLYAAGVQIAGKGLRNVVFVVSMHNSVYAIDADAPQSTLPLWQVNLGAPVPSSVLNFRDILPEVGILSTPVIDLGQQVMYLVSETLENQSPVFRIHALSLADGHETMHGPTQVAAAVAGTGAGAVDEVVTFDPALHLQRPGLALVNGTVYLAFGSHGDAGNFHGWLIGYNAADLKRPAVVRNTSPNGLGASIWQTGRAPAIDDGGNIYVSTGNGDFDGLSGFGESVLKLAGADLSVGDFYTPDNWSDLSDNDNDFSTGVVLIPNTNLAVAGDKAGALHLINRDSMGHLTAGSPNTAQSLQIIPSGIFDIAVWNSADGPIVYVLQPFVSLQAYQIVNGIIDGTMLSQTAPTLATLFAGIAITADGAGAGIVWETTADLGKHGVPGTLHAYDASDLSNELWNSEMVPGDTLGQFAKFVAPTVVNGRVYVPTFSDQLAIYGLLGGDAPQPGPAQIVAVVNGASFLGGSVCPGEVVQIFGANLGPPQPSGQQVDDTGHVSTGLSDTQVFFDGVSAPLLYTSSNQISAVVPFGTAGPMTQIEVRYQGQLSQPLMLPVVAATPALFSQDGTGGGQGAVLNEDGGPNSWDAPASSGSLIVFYATGAGQTVPAGDDGNTVLTSPSPAPLLPIQVFIGDQPALVLFAGAAQGMVQGILQINALVPDNLVSGEVQITLRVGAYSSPNTVTLIVQ